MANQFLLSLECTAYPQGFITYVITRLYRHRVHFDLHASRAPQSIQPLGAHRTLLEELAHRWFHVHLRTLIGQILVAPCEAIAKCSVSDLPFFPALSFSLSLHFPFCLILFSFRNSSYNPLFQVFLLSHSPIYIFLFTVSLLLNLPILTVSER